MKTLIIHNLDDESATIGTISLRDDGSVSTTGVGDDWANADKVRITNLTTLQQALPADGIEWLFGLVYEITHHGWLQWAEIVDDQEPVIVPPRPKTAPGPEPQPYPLETP